MALTTERIAEYREQARTSGAAAIQSTTLMLIDSLRPSYAAVYRALVVCEPETSEYIAACLGKPVAHVSTALDYCRRVGLVRVERVLIDPHGKHNVWRLDRGMDEGVSPNQAEPAPVEASAAFSCPATVDHRCGRTDCVGAVCRLMEGEL